MGFGYGIPGSGGGTVASGGTGITSYTTGDMLYASAGTTLSKLAIGTAGKFLKSTGTAPSWANILASDVGAATMAVAWTVGTGGSIAAAGSGTITATAVPASGITGATLAANVVTSSLTSVGTLTSLGVAGTTTLTTGAIASSVVDGASNIGFTLTTASMSTSGAKLLSIKNSATEKFYVDYSGSVNVTGSLASDLIHLFTNASASGSATSVIAVRNDAGSSNGNLSMYVTSAAGGNSAALQANSALTGGLTLRARATGANVMLYAADALAYTASSTSGSYSGQVRGTSTDTGTFASGLGGSLAVYNVDTTDGNYAGIAFQSGSPEFYGGILCRFVTHSTGATRVSGLEFVTQQASTNVTRFKIDGATDTLIAGCLLDLSAISAGSPNLKITATSDTPTVAWNALGGNAPTAAPAGYMEITVGASSRYIPYWA